MPRSAAMEALSPYFSASGRIAPKPFAISVVILYLVSFGSRALLATPVLGRGGIGPFVVVQALLAWFWFSLHAKRLRDAGRGLGAAVAVVVLYVIAIILVMAIAMLTNMPVSTALPGDGAPSAGWAEILIVLYLLALISGDPQLGVFGYVLMGIFLAVLAPIMTALLFSLWAGTRPSVLSGP